MSEGVQVSAIRYNERHTPSLTDWLLLTLARLGVGQLTLSLRG
jgi:hypothetical protein